MSAAGRGDRIFAGDAAMGRVELSLAEAKRVQFTLNKWGVFITPIRQKQNYRVWLGDRYPGHTRILFTFGRHRSTTAAIG